MAHKRRWNCYRKWEHRPYQYKRSWNHKREYARGGTQSKIVRYWGGASEVPWDEWELVVGLKINKKVQISSNTLEAVRVTINSALQNKLGRTGYRLNVRPKPFHKYRENRMLAFAGADRVQSGMRNSFGRAMGMAARVKAGQIICEVGCNLKNLPLVRDRIRITGTKLPSTSQVVILKYKTMEIFKQSGLPLYNAKTRLEIPLYEITAA